jgi:hypothetical protein
MCGSLTLPRVFFGHQSVGSNIVDGLADVQRAGGGFEFPIVCVDSGVPDAGPFFSHARLGRNGDPRSKTDAFVEMLERGLGSRVNVAFHKYCYADIDAGTDPDALFSDYCRAMHAVGRRWSDVAFLHVTVPLMQVQAGPKALVKKWLGREPDHYADNIARERFNDRMRAAFGGRCLFDLASIEASAAGVALHTQAFGTTRVLSLRPEYTDDGAHLNQRGRRHVARTLVGLLADLPVSQGSLC